MRLFQKTLALLAAALMLALPVLSSPITAQADENEPVTYYLRYLPELSEWKYQQLSAWDENDNYGGLDWVLSNIKDGDLLVIDGNEKIELNLKVHLSNLTIKDTTGAIVYANGIDDFYGLNGVCAVNSDVKNAYLYHESVCNFNKNVENLTLYGEPYIGASAGSVGTVSHVWAGDSEGNLYYEFYDFAPGKLSIVEGDLKTPEGNYSTAPSASTPAPAPAPSAPAAGGSSSEYDDVPKTGEINPAPWLLLAAAACLFGSVKLRKR